MRTVALMACLSAVPAFGSATTLYDGSLGTTPVQQGYLTYAYNIFAAAPLVSTSSGATQFNSAASLGSRAGGRTMSSPEAW